MQKEKCCENCGEQTINWFYRLICSVEYVVFLNSPYVSLVDTTNKFVLLKDGTEYRYDLLFQDLARSIGLTTPHIFCSEKCEDWFVAHNTFVYRPDLPIATPILRLRENGMFAAYVFQPAAIHHTMSVCHHCNDSFPNLHKSFKTTPILDMRVEPGRLGYPPDVTNFPMAFSDISEKHPVGNFYLIKLDLAHLNQSEASFCSNECAFSYAHNEHKLVAFPNNMMEGQLTAISPFTERINQGLSPKRYRYKPQRLPQ